MLMYCNNGLMCLLLLVVAAASASGKCVQKSTCVCEDTETGLVIDLEDLFGYEDDDDGDDAFLKAVADDDSTYYFHGCVDAVFNVDVKNISGDECNENSITFCYFDGATRKLIPVGNASSFRFAADPKHNDLTNIVYKQEKQDFVIGLVCSPELLKPELVVKEPKKLMLYSKYACKVDARGLSGGSQLLIAFFVCVALYLISGMLFTYCVVGGRGVEMIPNLNFWKQLPSLIKDGFKFVVSGCKVQQIYNSM